MGGKRIEDYNKTLPVIEVYYAIQSEGSRAGFPTVVVRTTGCTHRCFFGEGGWCDSWYTSIHPEKGKYTFQDIIDAYDKRPDITEMMLTGGSPTMHPILVNELTHFAKERNIVITIETEGSHYLETDYPINLLSISPKFSNSVPQLGVTTPQGRQVDERMIKQHNKFRLNIPAIAKSIKYHDTFHLKPVVAKDLSNIPEIEKFIEDLAEELRIPTNIKDDYWSMLEKSEIMLLLKKSTWLMAAGDDIPALLESYGPVMKFATEQGYKFSGRPHIIAFGTEREV